MVFQQFNLFEHKTLLENRGRLQHRSAPSRSGNARGTAQGYRGNCQCRGRALRVTIVETLNLPPIRFDARLTCLVGQAALEIGATTLKLHCRATHDANFMATTMIFIPCREGLSHNEAEWAEPDHMIAGANVLFRVIRGLAVEHDPRE